MSAPFALMMITTVETLLSHYNGHAVHYHHYYNLLRHFATGNDRDVIITRVVNEHLGAGSEIPYLLSSLYSLSVITHSSTPIR